MSDKNCCGACGYPIHATKDKACDWCRQTADRIEALTAENKRLGQQCEGLMQAGMNNGQALIIAEAKLAKAVELLRRHCDPMDMSNADVATLAEIENSEAVTLGEKT
jgi:flagellar biosynthesis/type III secretory pathway chaperone